MGLQWDLNPDFADLPVVSAGDRIVLHTEGGWQYRILADVLAVGGDSIEATVIEIHTRQLDGGRITGGGITGLEGQTFKLKTAHVFKVLKGQERS